LPVILSLVGVHSGVEQASASLTWVIRLVKRATIRPLKILNGETHMKAILVAAVAVAAFASNAALASEQLAKEKNCLACHAIDNKVVGPGYKEVAAKYKGDKSAEAKLATKIQKGGSGVWGQIPMPANPQVSEAEAKKLSQWILSLK